MCMFHAAMTFKVIIYFFFMIIIYTVLKEVEHQSWYCPLN